MATDDKFVFIAEWWDQQASIMRDFFLDFYLEDKSISIYDRKLKRPFLKRVLYP